MRRRPAFFKFFSIWTWFLFWDQKIFSKKLFSHDIKPFLTNLGIKVIRNYLIFSISTFIHHKNSGLVNKVPKSVKIHLLGVQCVFSCVKLKTKNYSLLVDEKIKWKIKSRVYFLVIKKFPFEIKYSKMFPRQLLQFTSFFCWIFD